MEDPTTWDETTRLIHETLRECEVQSSMGFYGGSRAKQIRDALNEAGLLRTKDD